VLVGLFDSDPYGLKILSVYMSGITASCAVPYHRTSTFLICNNFAQEVKTCPTIAPI
jgi:DNA topoisomerase VI subunit A